MSFSSITSFAASGNGRSWQGCASDGTNVWLISDRTTQTVTHVLSNNIETYDRSGTRTDIDTAIYTATTGGLMWNFVDGYYNSTDGYLYVCCTNFHSNAYVETACQILVLNPATWATVTSYALTTLSGSIESITKRGTEWWVCWSGSQSIRRYDSTFSTIIGTYSLEEHATPFGGADVKWWQGLDWHGDVLFANLHGENDTGGTYAPGLEQYWWNGTKFEWIKTHTPPAYGCGQGFCRVPNTNELWFADRPGIALVKSTIGDIAAKSFNGTTTQIRGGTLTAIDDLPSNAMTISAWITPTSTGEGGTGRIATKRNVTYPATDANGGWLFYITGTASISWIVANSSGSVIGQQTGNSNSIVLATRQHVLLTYNNAGDRKAHIYVNGVEITYATNTAASGTVGTDATGELMIGNTGDASRTFDGLIEDFAIWPSVLNSTKIALLAGGSRAASVDGTYVSAMPNLAATFVSYSLTCAAGSYSYTGVAVTLTVKHNLICATGSYTYSGVSAALPVNRSLSCASGSYTYSGVASTLSVARGLSCDAGSYTYAGVATTLAYIPGDGTVDYVLTCAVGSYTCTGQSATLSVRHSLTCAAGAYAYSGVSASLQVDHRLTCDVGAYAYTGQNATLSVKRSLACATGSYDYIGNTATLDYLSGAASINYVLTCAAGAYTYAGQSATLTVVGSWAGEPFNFASPITRNFDFTSSITKTLAFDSSI